MENTDLIDLKRLYFILKRRIGLIALITSLFVCSAIAYIYVTPAQYTAQTVLLLDKSATNTISNVSSLNLTTFEPAAIDSEVEIIRSKRITDHVAQLLKDEHYIKNIIEKDQGDTLLFDHLRRHLSVQRIGQTYTLSIKYTSQNPEQSSEIANAFAQAYINEQLDSLSETSEKTLLWLQEKSNEIGEKLNDARKRLQEKKEAYNQQARKRNPKTTSDVSLEDISNLEKEASTYETIYQSYLEKIRVIGLEQSFPVTETRVITYATPPLHKSHPKEKVILAIALVFGAGLGTILALISDLFDKTLRRAGQVQREINVPFLGFYPISKSKKKTPINFMNMQGHSVLVGLNLDAINGSNPLCTETSLVIKNTIDRFNQDPKVTNINHKHKVIGVVSTFNQEGASFVANNIALTCANSGQKTVLIDSNLYDPAELNIKTTKAKKKNFAYSSDMLLSSNDYPLDYINKNLGNAHKDLRHLNQEDISALIKQLKETYDYTVIDLPPLHAASKFSAYAQEVDIFIILAEWGKSLPNSINFYLDLNKVEQERIAGMVLTKANMKKMKRHYGHASYAPQTSPPTKKKNDKSDKNTTDHKQEVTENSRKEAHDTDVT